MKKETLEEAAERNGAGRHSFILGANYMAERMYSEEEVLDLLSKISFDLKHKHYTKTTIEWFEKFKKK